MSRGSRLVLTMSWALAAQRRWPSERRSSREPPVAWGKVHGLHGQREDEAGQQQAVGRQRPTQQERGQEQAQAAEIDVQGILGERDHGHQEQLEPLVHGRLGAELDQQKGRAHASRSRRRVKPPSTVMTCPVR